MQDIAQNLTGESVNWIHWVSALRITTCAICSANHGRIFSIHEDVSDLIPVHMNCLCKIESMRTITAGLATYHGIYGADVYLVYKGILPEYYTDKKTAVEYGWKKKKGNLSDVLPGKMIGGDIFENRNGKLPYAEGRIWYEADINYSTGYRTKARLLYSNDGFVFATYDHYMTFYEIVGGNHV